MKCLVTGAAGFVGSHLCEELLRRGHDVVGLDAFIPYYPESVKLNNLAAFRDDRRFQFHRCDLRSDPIDHIVAGVEIIFHQAAMAGLIRSWSDFDLYWTCNVLATRRLLEALRACQPMPRLIYISTSSVYGRFSTGDESMPTRPISPYGVTKLAGENLCRAYLDVFGVPAVILRYFSVYGPRQRPDMGYHLFIKALLHNEPVTVYGDGQQVRGNSYVDDCVAATVAAAAAPIGEVYNVGGGESASVWDILRKLEAIAGTKAHIKHEAERPGDQRATFADTTKLRRHFAWAPKVGLEEGLRRQWQWQKSQAP